MRRGVLPPADQGTTCTCAAWEAGAYHHCQQRQRSARVAGRSCRGAAAAGGQGACLSWVGGWGGVHGGVASERAQPRLLGSGKQAGDALADGARNLLHLLVLLRWSRSGGQGSRASTCLQQPAGPRQALTQQPRSQQGPAAPCSTRQEEVLEGGGAGEHDGAVGGEEGEGLHGAPHLGGDDLREWRVREGGRVTEGGRVGEREGWRRLEQYMQGMASGASALARGPPSCKTAGPGRRARRRWGRRGCPDRSAPGGSARPTAPWSPAARVRGE